MRTCGLGLHQVGLGELQPRLGLRHVGDREFADAEALARGVELLDEDADVVVARIGDVRCLCTRSAYEVRGRKKDGMFGIGEHRALGLDVGLRLLGVGDGLAAEKERLGHDRVVERAIQDVVRSCGGPTWKRSIGLEFLL